MKLIQIIDVRWYNACADFAIKQAQGLIMAGEDVLLLVNPGSPPAKKARELGLETNEEIEFSRTGNFIWGTRRLREIAGKFGADVVMAHRGESHLTAGLASRSGRFKVARFRGDVRPPRRNILSNWLNMRMTNGIAVSSERLKIEYERRYRLDGIPVQVIYPGLDLGNFELKSSRDALRRHFGLNSEGKVIGIVGRFSPVKGHRYFIEAAKLVSLKHPASQFVIAGGDAQLTNSELQTMAAALKVPNMKIMGFVENVYELMATFDIGVVASLGSEMICRVLLEYFASGAAVVGTSVNQISELMLVSNGGVLAPAADSPALAEAIVKLIENDDLRRELSQRGRKWVEGRSLKTLGRETQSFLAEVINA
jgi:glycosyltransferase involved in cell wall biosynthesis